MSCEHLLIKLKNRSSVAAAILKNYKLLDEVKETSENSEGVGDMELEKVMDSADIKIKQLQNQLSELATVTIDTDGFKSLVESATSFLDVLTQIIDKLPMLSTLIGSIVGIRATKSGLGKQLNINYKASFNSKFYRS